MTMLLLFAYASCIFLTRIITFIILYFLLVKAHYSLTLVLCRFNATNYLPFISVANYNAKYIQIYLSHANSYQWTCSSTPAFCEFYKQQHTCLRQQSVTVGWLKSENSVGQTKRALSSFFQDYTKKKHNAADSFF